MLSINYFYEDIDFFIYNYKKISNFLFNIIKKELFNFNIEYFNSYFINTDYLISKKINKVFFKKKIKFKSINLNFIFCSDCYLNKTNIKYLNSNKLTDIIAFDNSGFYKSIQGDIYISIDRVSRNSFYYSVGFQKELFRVVLHGLLHLLGYNDKSFFLKKKMDIKESEYLKIFLNYK